MGLLSNRTPIQGNAVTENRGKISGGNAGLAGRENPVIPRSEGL